jgi:hypothetical protein
MVVVLAYSRTINRKDAMNAKKFFAEKNQESLRRCAERVLQLTRKFDGAARSLSVLGDRREHGGRAGTEVHDIEAHSGAMQRNIGGLWAALPPAQ